MARSRRASRRIDQMVRYPVITRRERFAAAWAGWRDGRRGLPAGEATPDRLPPACAVIHANYASLLSRLESDYRVNERGFAAALEAAVAALEAPPPGDPTEAGPAGRNARGLMASRATAVAAGRQAADQLRATHRQAKADFQAVRAVAGQALGVYTRTIYRWHRDGPDLSARNWMPPGLPLPEEQISIRPDLVSLLKRMEQPDQLRATLRS